MAVTPVMRVLLVGAQAHQRGVFRVEEAAGRMFHFEHDRTFSQERSC